MSEPANAKKVRLAAEALGFEVFTFEATVLKPAVLWASTADGHNEGDERSPEKVLDGWFLRARHKQVPDRLAFEAIWAGGFKGVRVVDIVGKPVELYVDYSYGAAELKAYGYTREYADKKTALRDLEYNTGEIFVKHKYRIGSWSEFTGWFDELIDLFKSPQAKISPKPRAPKKEKSLLDDFDGGDWIG